MSVGSAPIEYMFEETSDGVLIDVMGEATRDESTASAQWMLAVVSYMPGAPEELSETFWWRSDPTDEAAAKIAAAQNISPRGRGCSRARRCAR